MAESASALLLLIRLQDPREERANASGAQVVPVSSWRPRPVKEIQTVEAKPPAIQLAQPASHWVQLPVSQLTSGMAWDFQQVSQ